MVVRLLAPCQSPWNHVAVKGSAGLFSFRIMIVPPRQVQAGRHRLLLPIFLHHVAVPISDDRVRRNICEIVAHLDPKTCCHPEVF